MTEAAARNADYQVTVDDLAAGRGARRPHPGSRDRADPHRLRAALAGCRHAISARPSAARPAVAKLHFPGLHPDAAAWLVANRSIAAIGIDTASIDYGQSTLFESHRALFAKDIPAFENLASLERLPARGAHVIALPMKIAGGSGAPLRVIAILAS